MAGNQSKYQHDSNRSEEDPSPEHDQRDNDMIRAKSALNTMTEGLDAIIEANKRLTQLGQFIGQDFTTVFDEADLQDLRDRVDENIWRVELARSKRGRQRASAWRRQGDAQGQKSVVRQTVESDAEDEPTQEHRSRPFSSAGSKAPQSGQAVDNKRNGYIAITIAPDPVEKTKKRRHHEAETPDEDDHPAARTRAKCTTGLSSTPVQQDKHDRLRDPKGSWWSREAIEESYQQ